MTLSYSGFIYKSLRSFLASRNCKLLFNLGVEHRSAFYRSESSHDQNFVFPIILINFSIFFSDVCSHGEMEAMILFADNDL